MMGKSGFGIMVLVVLFIISEEASATQHAVGGSQGWDQSTDFKSWASSKTFKVGDSLLFKYTAGLHSVVELAGDSAYKSCDTSTALDSKSGGNNVVKLDKPGTRYFACGTAGHCGSGMKVQITTVAANGGSTSPSSDTNTSSSSSPSTTTDSSPAVRIEVLAPLALTFFCILLHLSM